MEHGATLWARPAWTLVGAACVLLAALWFAGHPDLLDRPLARFLNSGTGPQELAGRVASSLVNPVWEGLLLTCLVWYCWFSDADPGLRAQLLAGVCTAALAGALGHLLHQTLPFRPRPIFDGALLFRPSGVLGALESLRAEGIAQSSSFPSERAVLYAGIAAAIVFVHFRLGLLAVLLATLPELARIYLGLHYATDIVGSACIGVALVCLAQFRWALDAGDWALVWERSSAPTFYAAAFLFSYQVATAFESVRGLLRGA